MDVVGGWGSVTHIFSIISTIFTCRKVPNQRIWGGGNKHPFGILLNKRLEGLTEITVAALFQRLKKNLSTYTCVCSLCVFLSFILSWASLHESPGRRINPPPSLLCPCVLSLVLPVSPQTLRGAAGYVTVRKGGKIGGNFVCTVGPDTQEVPRASQTLRWVGREPLVLEAFTALMAPQAVAATMLPCFLYDKSEVGSRWAWVVNISISTGWSFNGLHPVSR